MRSIRMFVLAGLSSGCIVEGNPQFADALDPTSESSGDPTSELADDPTSSDGTNAEAESTLASTSSDDTSSDSGGSVPWYADVDGDGYGDPNSQMLAPQAPPGHVDDDRDCDDDEPRINPDGLLCPATPELIGWWVFDPPPDGRNFVDISPAGRLLEAFGPPALLDDSPYGGAVEFSGANTYLDGEPLAQLIAPRGVPPTEFTLEVWAHSSMLMTHPQHLVYFGDGGDGFGDHPEAHLSLDTDGQWVWFAMTDGDRCSVTAPADLGRWTHIAVVQHQDSCELYLDGSLVDADEGAALVAPWRDFFIARGAIDNRPFHGRLDDLMIFSTARGPFEIATDCGPACED